jgi:YidC/Oxa1 family membrane protein insertase
MFTALIVKPIFNLLVFIYAILPGHNFGLSIIIFTVLVRLIMWPLVKKQLHQAKAMRELQPELKRIKKAAAGNKQKESLLMMELYKEKEINPFASLGLLVVQIPILIGLYSGVHRIVNDPHAIINFSYSFVHSMPWLKSLAQDIAKFDGSLFGVVDLTRAAIGKNGGGIYWPAMIIVLASVVMQYFQAVQLMPQDKDKRKLRDILKDAGNGKQADSTEVNAAVAGSTKYILPFFILLVTVNIASALSLYLLVSGAVAFAQQSHVLNQDKQELSTASGSTDKAANAIEAEIVDKPKKALKQNSSKNKNTNKSKKGGKKRKK